MIDISKIIGLSFLADTGEWYGSVRELGNTLPTGYIENNTFPSTPLASDDCGNLFVLHNDRVYFWDHETEMFTDLNINLNDFVANCSEYPEEEISIPEEDVESVWVDPEFAKKFGIKTPKDGWKKKP